MSEKTKHSEFENTLFSGLGISIMVVLFSAAYIINIGKIQGILPSLKPYSWKVLGIGLLAIALIVALLNLKNIGKGVVWIFRSIFKSVFKGVKGTLKVLPDTNNIFEKKLKTSTYDGSSFGPGLPPISLLGSMDSYVESKNYAESTKVLINKLFKDFSLDCSVGNYQVGPTVTRFYLNLSPTLKIRDVTSLQEDLAARIKSRNLRIATSNGVFIEVPNKEKQNVTQREIMEELRTQKLSQLSMVCGRSGSGEAYFVDLAKAPHLLVGGATGGGKSVCVNSLIITLLMKNSPEDLKLIMIDPKVIEFEFYQDLPHLLFPVANSLEKSVEVLKWCVKEMNRRYVELRNIKKKNLIDIPIKERPFPIIVIVIDELAELTMSKQASELTDSLNSLARMARAAGMYMILATQRPDKDAIPGQLKSNIPSSIALKVKHDYESKIILGQMGAEKLVGKGDMLINMNGEEELVRCQGSFLKDEHIESVVNWWKDNYKGNSSIDNNNCTKLHEGKNTIVFNFSDEPIFSEDASFDAFEKNSDERNEQGESPEETLRKSICMSLISNDEDTDIVIPPIRDLADSMETTTHQIRIALEVLKKEGWIETEGSTKNSRNIVRMSRKDAEIWLSKNGS